jgi:hypothetical protein
MSQSFPAGGSRNSLMWAVILALLINTPLFSILLLSGINTVTMTLVSILPVTVSALIIYSSYAAGKMEYILEEDELRVNFPLSPIKISYKKIKEVAKVETTLRLRLLGGSLPGAHWGTFSTSNLGSTQVYSTRYTGEFVLLELSKGDRILISPLEPDAFIEALRKKTQFTTPNLNEANEPPLDRRLAAAQIAVVTLAWLALAAYIATIYPGLPEVIPVHFGLNGVPNRYGSKVEMLYLVALSTIFPIMNAVFALKFGKYNKVLNIFLSVVFLLALGLFGLVVNQILQAI